MASYQQGYEDDRFENVVGQNFHCPICMNVLKDPVMCQGNQHCFCRPCITRYLENSQTCPTCKEELTVETLSEVPRIFKVCWSEFSIRCDYFKRGCRELVQLGDLETHVNNCGFSPVVCSNQGCLVEINKRDRTHHETEVCQFRKVKCHDCFEIRKELDEVKIELSEVKVELSEVKVELSEVKNNLQEMQMNFTAVNNETKTNMAAMKNDIKLIMNINSQAVNDKLEEIKIELRTLQDQTVCGIQTKNEKMKNDMAEAKIDVSDDNHGIIIAGGRSGQFILNSVEWFDWSKKMWIPLQQLKERRETAASFVFKNQMIVTGGWDVHGRKDTTEGVRIMPARDSEPWFDFPAKLPFKLSRHGTVVSHDRLIVIGGHDEIESIHDSIHEVLLVPPYTSRLLTRMPHARCCHGSQLYNDKILICGGRKTRDYRDIVDSVIMYDISKNECKLMSPLPYAVSEMATVSWGDNIIVIGGVDKDLTPLNTVVIYNVKTEKSHMLPAMKYERKGCVAVVLGNAIVVMGGKDERENDLNFVESFSFDRYSWENLSSMTELRSWATGVAW